MSTHRSLEMIKNCDTYPNRDNSAADNVSPISNNINNDHL